ncbi:MAG: InlB B-repeat-containing protein [Atopobiaceae bacterium]|nr:InlB B-repeat-containing protein [Atopobiaceae bacterium]
MASRRTTIAALVLAVFAILVVVMMAMPRVARAENSPVTMRVDETVDVLSANYGKPHEYHVTGCQYDTEIISVEVLSPDDTLRIKGLKAGNTTIAVSMQYSDSKTEEHLSVTVLDHPMVTLNAGAGGSVNPAEPTRYPQGTTVNILATANPGYEFDKWTSISGTSAIDPSSPTASFAMPDSDVSATATFKAMPYNVTTSADGNGTLVASQSEGITVGTNVTLTATPAEGHKLKSITGTYQEGGETKTFTATESPHTFAMPASDVEAKAVFQKDETPTNATLTFDLAGGTLDGKTGTYTITEKVGNTIKLPGAPTRAGYTFKCWKGSEYAAGAEYKVEGDHTFTAEWARGDYPIPTVSNSRGGTFTSTSQEITYTVSQEVPDYANSLRTWVDLEDVLSLTTDEVTVQTEDGTAIGSDVARVSIDGQKITVTVDDATSLRGKTLKFSYKAKLRSDADLSPYMNAEGNTASVPYQAHTVFDGNENDVKHSKVEHVNFRVSKSPSGSSSTKTASSGRSSSGSTLAKTGDPTPFVPAAMMAASGASLALTGRKRR